MRRSERQVSTAERRAHSKVRRPAALICSPRFDEIGHALGLPDTYDAEDRDKVMYGFLTKGERRVPAAGDAAKSTHRPE